MQGRHVSLYSWTFDQISGIRIAHDIVVWYLSQLGFSIESIYSFVSPPPHMPWEPFGRPKLDKPLYTTWYYGFTTSYNIGLTEIPLVFWHGYVEGIPQIPKEMVDILLEKTIFIAPTKFVKEMLAKIGIHTDIIYNPGVHPMRLIPSISQVKKLIGMKRGRKMFCYIADNQPRKGIPNVIEAYRIVRKEGYKDTILYILTSNDKNIPKDLPENTIIDISMFTVPDPYIAAIYHACDIYVHGAMSEGLGLPIMEAQTVGLPVVIVDAPPMNEICRDPWCYKAKWRRIEWYDAFGGEVKTIKHVYEPEDLAEAMIKALQNEWDRKYIANIARKYEYTNTLKGIEQVIIEAIEERLYKK